MILNDVPQTTPNNAPKQPYETDHQRASLETRNPMYPTKMQIINPFILTNSSKSNPRTNHAAP